MGERLTRANVVLLRSGWGRGQRQSMEKQLKKESQQAGRWGRAGVSSSGTNPCLSIHIAPDLGPSLVSA